MRNLPISAPILALLVAAASPAHAADKDMKYFSITMKSKGNLQLLYLTNFNGNEYKTVTVTDPLFGKTDRTAGTGTAAKKELNPTFRYQLLGKDARNETTYLVEFPVKKGTTNCKCQDFALQDYNPVLPHDAKFRVSLAADGSVVLAWVGIDPASMKNVATLISQQQSLTKIANVVILADKLP